MLGALVGVFVIATALSGYLVFATVRDFVAGWQMTSGGGGTVSPGSGTAAPGATAEPATAPVQSIIPRPWTGTDRVTVLLMGIDRRSGEEEKAYRTDSMMLVSVDPVAKTAVMLSIPRDLWVEIPGFDTAKITEANFKGDAFEYPGGGPALAMKTVEYNLGVDVDYYVRLDFTAFETLVDTIGGIDVVVAETIDDPEYPDGAYGYEPFYLAAGRQHLNGHDALRYARTRHTGQGDIDRARRQQEVIMAVRDKVLSLNMLPTLLVKAPTLFRSLNENVKTDLSLDQIVSLALLGQEIPRENIIEAVIDYRYVTEGMTPDNQQVLIPLRDKIRELRDELFTTSAPLAPATGVDEKTLIAAEAARVTVLNGAGVPGLAQATAEWLTAQGINVVAFDTADRSDYPTSVILEYSGKPYTTAWLARTFRVSSTLSGTDPDRQADIHIILGADWRVPDTGTP